MRTVRRLQEASPTPPRYRLVLDYDARQKTRFLAKLESGEEIALRLPRGTVLADGDRLLSDDGDSIEVVAAAETLSVATTDDDLLFARAAYHLGNRHVPLQIGVRHLAFRHDHVLDDLMRRLGMKVDFKTASFVPERGAYDHGSSHPHTHGHAHTHDHSHDHAHTHDHPHADHPATHHGARQQDLFCVGGAPRRS
jgi:urease accessory protein